MSGYVKQQEMMGSVLEDIQACRDLVGKKDEEKNEIYGFVPGMDNMEAQESALDTQIKQLKEGIFQVLFTGGFSAGKSTLLNALMRKDVLRTSITAETAVITKIVFDAEEKAIVYKKKIGGDGKMMTEEYSVEDFFQVYRVDQDNPEKFELIEYVQLQQAQDGIGGSLVQLVDSPGTSNSEADTSKARDFAEKASAVVYLINAVMAFTDEDKSYIKSHYAGKGMKNLFFVINRFDSVQPSERPELKASVRQQLNDVFTINGWFDEELFNSRVFYTNAFGSLMTRLGKPTPTPFGEFMLDDNTTGVPEFEAALEKFLTDGSRDRDALAAYIPRLSTIYVVAEDKVREELELYRQGIDKIKADKEALEASMEKVKGILDGIEDTCRVTALDLVREVKNAYDSYKALVESGWDPHFSDPEVLRNIKFGITDLIKLAAAGRNEEKKKKLLKPIQVAIEEYINDKSKSLEASIQDITEAQLLKLEKSLRIYQDQLDNLDCPVSAGDIMKSIQASSTKGGVSAPGVKVNAFQLVLGILGADPEIAMGSLTGQTSNKQAIMSSISKNVFEFVALYVVAWPIGLGMLAKRGYDMWKGTVGTANNAAKELLLQMKGQTMADIEQGKAKVAMEIEKGAGGSFIRAGKTFSESFLMEMNSYTASYNEMLINLEKTGFTVEDEKSRTDKLLEEFRGRIIHISEVTRGVSMDKEEILEMAESK